MSLEPMLTINDVAKLMKLSTRTIHRWKSNEQTPEPARRNGVVRWHDSDIELWLELGLPSREEFEKEKKKRRKRGE